MALNNNQELPPLSEALAGSEFEEELECIKGIFERLKISTVNDLDNSPRLLTCTFCGVSTHSLIGHIRSYMENPPPEPQEEPEDEDAVLIVAEAQVKEEEESGEKKPSKKKASRKKE